MSKNNIKASLFRFLSNSLYIIFNIFLVVGIIISINIFESVFIAVILVILAKWRMFAVKIRYWLTNLKSAIVDYSVGFSFVFIMYYLQEISLYTQIIVAVMYLLWLIIIKQKASEKFMLIQSLLAVFLFNLVICLFSDENPMIINMVFELIVGYFSVWHYLMNYDFDKKTKRLISGFWSMTLSQLLWISQHWLIGYPIGVNGIKISQLSIISMLLTYSLFLILHYSYKHRSEKNRINLMIAPMVLSIFVCLMLIISS